MERNLNDLWMSRLWCGCVIAMLSACSSLPDRIESLDVGETPWAEQSVLKANLHLDNEAVQAHWQHYRLPGKAATQFIYARKDGRDAMSAHADSSASMLRYAVRVEPEDLGKVRFSWKVPELIAHADLAVRETADSPVRIVLAFDGDRSRLSPRDVAMSELARALTGEELPYATLMYVWCNQREPGAVIRSPRTDRIRKLVVETGPRNLNKWMDYEQDVRRDYLRAFGELPGPLIGIGIMTDSDNTRTSTKAWYGPVTLGVTASRGDTR